MGKHTGLWVVVGVVVSCARCHVAESVPFFTAQYPEGRLSLIRPPEYR